MHRRGQRRFIFYLRNAVVDQSVSEVNDASLVGVQTPVGGGRQQSLDRHRRHHACGAGGDEWGGYNGGGGGGDVMG